MTSFALNTSCSLGSTRSKKKKKTNNLFTIVEAKNEVKWHKFLETMYFLVQQKSRVK